MRMYPLLHARLLIPRLACGAALAIMRERFRNVTDSVLPTRLRRELFSLVRHVYSERGQEVPVGTFVSIGFLESRPSACWVNMIEFRNKWRMAFSVNSENHTVKIGRSESVDDLEHSTYEPIYEPLGSKSFDTLLKEITEVVHTQHWEADEAALDEMLMMTDAPVRLHKSRIPQATDTEGTSPVPIRKVKLEEDTGLWQTPPKRVKLAQRTAVKQEATGGSMLSSVTQEPSSCGQPATSFTCTCGGRATRCSAPGCHQLYCPPCDLTQKATNPAEGFKTCSFYCCMSKQGFSKVQFCAAHHSLLFNGMVCQQVFCKRPCCSQCKLAVCQHCIDSHEEAGCAGSLH